MLQAIANLGGWLLMMGQHDRSESLFYYFRIEDQVPENHLLRFIDRYVSFDFVRENLRASYSETGRPSIDPEVLLRILLLGYLYGITSKRKLLEELRMHLAWRWFTGFGFEQEVPHHSTFSKNRHGRFQESNLFQELFERIVEQCIAAGLVQGEQMSVDGSFIMANASHHSRIPREQFREAAQVNYGARKYLEELEQENGDGEPIHQQDKVSTTDPDSTYLTKGNRAAELGYFDNYLIDNESCVIVGVQATAARLSQESAAARDMIDRYCERYGRRPKGVAADNIYGNGEMLQWLDERGITPYIRVKEGPNSPPDLYGIEKFTYVPEENCGSVALFVGKRAVEKAAAWKSPKAGLSHSAWKSRESGWISTFPTAPVTAAFNFLDSESKGIAELQRARLVCCFSQQKTDRPGDQLFNYRLRPF
jgi:transposase